MVAIVLVSTFASGAGLLARYLYMGVVYRSHRSMGDSPDGEGFLLQDFQSECRPWSFTLLPQHSPYPRCRGLLDY